MEPPNIDLWAFIIGSLSAFALKFLTYYKTKTKQQGKEAKKIFIDKYDTIYIILGGIFTMILNPINTIQAIILGGAWESIFVRLINSDEQKVTKP